MNPTVHITEAGCFVLLECSACGPVGVATSTEAADDHLTHVHATPVGAR